MPKSITVISLFLASPADVANERLVVSATVDEWNARHGRSLGVSFQLLTWEKSVSAGFSDDGQQVINEQINDDYDALIAIFWTRLGSPTKRDVSGSVEEYHRALLRLEEGEKVEIAFFFKDALVDFRNVDLQQLAAVKHFESEAQAAGALTRNFRDDESLRLEVSMLLDRLSRELALFHSASATKPPHPVQQKRKLDVVVSQDVAEEDVGLFDIVENLTRHADNGGRFLAQFTELMKQIKVVTEEVTNDYESIRSVRSLDPVEMKPGLIRIASAMDVFSTFVEQEMPEYSEDLSAVANNIRNMIRVSYDWLDMEEQMLPVLLPFREMVTGLYGGITHTQKN